MVLRGDMAKASHHRKCHFLRGPALLTALTVTVLRARCVPGTDLEGLCTTCTQKPHEKQAKGIAQMSVSRWMLSKVQCRAPPSGYRFPWAGQGVSAWDLQGCREWPSSCGSPTKLPKQKQKQKKSAASISRSAA